MKTWHLNNIENKLLDNVSKNSMHQYYNKYVACLISSIFILVLGFFQLKALDKAIKNTYKDFNPKKELSDQIYAINNNFLSKIYSFFNVV